MDIEEQSKIQQYAAIQEEQEEQEDPFSSPSDNTEERKSGSTEEKKNSSTEDWKNDSDKA